MRAVSFHSLLASAALLFMLGGCADDGGVFERHFLAFGTLVDLSVAGTTQVQADAAAEVLEADFAEMHRAWHAWDPGPLGRVNRLLREPAPFTTPPSLLELIKTGKRLSRLSDGLFNPAVGHLIDAWGFHQDDPDGHRPPAAEALATLVRQNPSMEDLEIDGIYLRSSNPSVKLDFGAFGKGYGIDIAVRRLREMKIDNAIVNAGGDLRAIGSRLGRPWRIAIRDPSGAGALAVIETRGDESVFTSGDYERYFTWEGRRFHHIIDPRTGYPAAGTSSVTVIHSNSTVADAAATALFIAGPDDWHRIARNMGIRYVLLVDADGRLHMNPEMRDRLELLRSDHTVVVSEPLF